MPPATVLIIESDSAFGKALRRILQRQGFRTLLAASVEAGAALLKQTPPAAILIDIERLENKAADACRHVRRISSVPLVVLCGPGQSPDCLVNIEPEIEACLIKPFGSRELTEHIQLALQKQRASAERPAVGRIQAGALEIDVATHQVWHSGRAVRLSLTEWAILELLIAHAGRIVTRPMFYRRLWGNAEGAGSSTLASYIRRLRRKLEEDPRRPACILTEPYYGYLFATPIATAEDSTAPAATAPAAGPATGNCPPPPADFLGREAESAAVLALLRRPEIRLVTLTGAGGTGKTSLALHVAACLRHEFNHGIWFVDLAPIRNAALVEIAIAKSLGLEDDGRLGSWENLRRSLAARHILLVLDNFEHVLAAAPVAIELLAAAPRLKILVTSRAALRLSREQRFEVPPLALPNLRRLPPPAELARSPAVALFTRRARAARADFELNARNAAAVAELCARLDGLPLAIELAAARIRLFSPQAMLARLTSRLTFLSADTRDRPPRQQTLRHTLDWSYDLLAAEEKLLLAQLGIFTGGWTIEAAEALCGAGMSNNVLTNLEALIDQSLVQAREAGGEMRFSMLETIREYAISCLTTAGEAADLHRRHAAYFVELAEQAQAELTGAGQEAWLTRLEQEHGNLRAALGWLLENGEIEMALRLTAAVWKFWQIHNHYSEGRQWMEAALAAAAAVEKISREQSRCPESNPPKKNASGRLLMARAQTLLGAGWLTYIQNLSRAETLFAESLAIARRLADRRLIVLALQGLGEIAQWNQNWLQAQALFEECLGHMEELDPAGDVETAWILDHLGRLALKQGHYTSALTHFLRSRRLFRKAGLHWGVALSLDRLGSVMLAQGKLRRARIFFEASLVRLRALEDKLQTAWAWRNIGRVALLQGDRPRARAALAESLKLHAGVDFHPGIGAALETLGALALAEGNVRRAARLYAVSETLLGPDPYPSPFDREQRTRALADIRARLNEADLTNEWAAGQALEVPQAVAYALDLR